MGGKAVSIQSGGLASDLDSQCNKCVISRILCRRNYRDAGLVPRRQGRRGQPGGCPGLLPPPRQTVYLWEDARRLHLRGDTAQGPQGPV